MAKVLFINASDRPAEQAVSVQMYNAFLQTYKEANPADEITELNLFKEDMPYYGNDAIMGAFKSNQGLELTPAEAKGASLIEKYLTQFFAADKIVFAFPLWNSTVPAPLISYVSYLAQAGKMFKYTAEGPVGFAGDKKVILLNARGSDYALEYMKAAEMSLNLVKAIISLWGINNPEEVVIEGHNQYPERKQEIVEAGLVKTAEAAAKF
ncbi:FMN-dependent NADH-azoreductase [Cytobacillus purgationiresistens]|uniref:FMN dependent NADH:quinone oxidoreductase n=1 Tax=Cytobacillus purgationiresistens TaxID=863449 RepID=A0ABU0AB66_9BACI|nr:FMN-dependent NADH-azoreductase [Cytobacillus purgationiresistens]MDQ0268493.1 FMN-dependent NADH-azoreductase [Cytobacillus purgationiresistens]